MAAGATFVGVLLRRNVLKLARWSSSTAGGLTTTRYPHVKRGPYAKLQSEDIGVFEQILPGVSRVITDPEDIQGYNQDWLGIYKGQGQIVLRPKSSEEVSAILKYCNERKLAVCPQGGNTGLVGGSVPLFDEVIISTQLLNKIISIDAVSGVLVSEAGCVLETLNDNLNKEGLMMPLDLGAKGSCHIGGNLATNAGGIRLLRYGSLHGSVLGLEVVLADGTILDCMSTLRKDNTGYDLKHLFVGSEGTLGLITKASILCPPAPQAVNVAFLGCESFDHVLTLLKLAREQLGEIISAFEFMDQHCMVCNIERLQMSSPLSEWPFYVLIETSGSNSNHDQLKLEAFLDQALSKQVATDGTIASEPSKIQALWQLRERITEGLVHDGHTYKYDLSLPPQAYYEIVKIVRSRLQGLATRVVGYGHVGDGNLHLNATSPTFDPEILQKMEPFVYNFTQEHDGSISAEHGLGFCKNQYIFHSKSKAAVDMMIRMKVMFDPNLILNPYKTLPIF